MDPFPVPSNYRNVSATSISSSSFSSSTSTTSSSSSSSSSVPSSSSRRILLSSPKPLTRPFKPTTVPLQTDDVNMFIEAIIITSLANYNHDMFSFPYLCRDLFFDTTFNDTLCNHAHPLTQRTRLMYACKMDNIERVQWLLKRNPHGLNMDSYGNTCLHHCLENWICLGKSTTTTSNSNNSGNTSRMVANNLFSPFQDEAAYYPMIKPITNDTITIIKLLLTKIPPLASVYKPTYKYYVEHAPTPCPLYVALRNPEMPEEIIHLLLKLSPESIQYINAETSGTCLSYAILHHPWSIIQTIFLAYPSYIFETSSLHGAYTCRCLDVLETKAMMDSDYTDILDFIKKYIEDNHVLPVNHDDD